MSADSGLDIGRRVKARRIAAAIRSLDGTAADARRMIELDWLHADMLSVQQTGHGGPKRGQAWKPPSDVTRALVIEYLERGDAEAAGCGGVADPGDPRDEDAPPA